MQYKYVIGYLRLSQDDEDKNDERSSSSSTVMKSFKEQKRYSFQMMDIAEQILTVRILKR